MAVGAILNLGVKYDLALLPYFYDLTDNTDYASLGIAASDVKGNFEIIDPLGQAYINTNWSTPDITLSVNTSFQTNIRLNANNFPYPGSYIFRYTVQIAGAVQPGTYSKDFTIDFTYQRPTVVIQFENNPYVTLLNARDITAYLIDGVTPVTSRIFTLMFPPLENVPDIVTTLAYIAVTAPFYLNGQYSATVVSDLIYVFDTYDVHDSTNGSNSIEVVDTIDIQAVYCCLKKLNQQIDVCRDPSNASVLESKLTRAMNLLGLFNQAVEFGRYADADAYIEQIYCVTGCTKGCSCGDSVKTSIQSYWLTVNVPSSGSSESNEAQIGDIWPTACSTIPSNWLFCIGQVLAIIDYQELFDVYGTAYNIGGEGGGNFRIPDFRGRSPIGAGTGSGLSNRVLGTRYGAEYYNATHSHTVTDIVIDNHVISPHVFELTIDDALGVVPITGTISGVTVSDVTGFTQPTVSGSGSVAVNVSGATSAAVTEDADAIVSLIVNPANPFGGIIDLPFTASNSYAPTGTVAGTTVSGTSGSTSLSISSEGGVVTSDTVSGVGVTPPACITAAPDEVHFDYMPCAGVTVDDFTVDIQVSSIAAALTVSPNGHTHSIPSLGVSGTFTATNSYIPTGSATLNCADLVGETGALTIDQTPHHHDISELDVTASGHIQGTDIAALLAVSSHRHTIPALTIDADFTGDSVDLTHTHAYTLTIDDHDDLIHIVSGSTDTTTIMVAVLHPVITTNFKIRVR